MILRSSLHQTATDSTLSSKWTLYVAFTHTALFLSRMHHDWPCVFKLPSHTMPYLVKEGGSTDSFASLVIGHPHTLNMSKEYTSIQQQFVGRLTSAHLRNLAEALYAQSCARACSKTSLDSMHVKYTTPHTTVQNPGESRVIHQQSHDRNPEKVSYALSPDIEYEKLRQNTNVNHEMMLSNNKALPARPMRSTCIDHHQQQSAQTRSTPMETSSETGPF